MILNSAHSLGFKQRSRTGRTSRNIPCCIRSNTPAPGPCVCLVYCCLSDQDKTGLLMTQRVCVAQCVCHCLSISVHQDASIATQLRIIISIQHELEDTFKVKVQESTTGNEAV